ncbi:hypothetical protein S83_011938 [Arachis hypogaea]
MHPMAWDIGDVLLVVANSLFTCELLSFFNKLIQGLPFLPRTMLLNFFLTMMLGILLLFIYFRKGKYQWLKINKVYLQLFAYVDLLEKDGLYDPTQIRIRHS